MEKLPLNERGIAVSQEEFLAKMEEQKEKARSARAVIMEKGQDSFIEEFYDKHGVTEFTGYHSTEEKAKLLNIRQKEDGTLLLIFDKTPFYGESGGQVGDHGSISSEAFQGKVLDVKKQKEIFTHIVEVVSGEVEEGKEYTLTVDSKYRAAVSKNHTATHLLHKALREVLGTHVQQAGSLVDSEKLRFDFSHYEAMTEEQIQEVEERVNEKISEAIAVEMLVEWFMFRNSLLNYVEEFMWKILDTLVCLK